MILTKITPVYEATFDEFNPNAHDWKVLPLFLLGFGSVYDDDAIIVVWKISKKISKISKIFGKMTISSRGALLLYELSEREPG